MPQTRLARNQRLRGTGKLSWKAKCFHYAAGVVQESNSKNLWERFKTISVLG